MTSRDQSFEPARSLKSKLLCLAFGLLATTLLATIFAVYRMEAGNEALGSLYNDRVVSIEQLKDIGDAYGNGIIGIAHRVGAKTLSADEGLRTVQLAQDVIDKRWKEYASSYLDGDERPLVAQATPLISTANAAVKRLLELLSHRDVDGVRQFSDRDLYSAIDPVDDVIERLARVQLKSAGQEYAEAQRLYQVVLRLAVIFSGLLIIAASAIALGLVRSITSGVDRAVRIAETVSSGDLTSQIVVDRGDEIGKLLVALKNMNRNLLAIVGEVREASESIATGSSQIANGNADLSQRTEEQASNLQQTAASMEELSATVHHNAETARRANELADSASEVAERGGQAVAKVAATMNEISESSRRIGDITSIIDGIAFQTNILALNAAVEAARAGRQGRGFAVVAGEVRTLAQRAAAAAKEIKTLIDASSAKVADGGLLAEAAGNTMQEIVSQVHNMRTLMAEIGSSRHEQSVGISQVSAAVIQLDQVTQQNAALVEESAAAAESLKQQADALARSVAVFRLT